MKEIMRENMKKSLLVKFLTAAACSLVLMNMSCAELAQEKNDIPEGYGEVFLSFSGSRTLCPYNTSLINWSLYFEPKSATATETRTYQFENSILLTPGSYQLTATGNCPVDQYSILFTGKTSFTIEAGKSITLTVPYTVNKEQDIFNEDLGEFVTCKNGSINLSVALDYYTREYISGMNEVNYQAELKPLDGGKTITLGQQDSPSTDVLNFTASDIPNGFYLLGITYKGKENESGMEAGYRLVLTDTLVQIVSGVTLNILSENYESTNSVRLQ